MFLKVISTEITQEIEPKCPYKVEPVIKNDEDVARTNRKLLSDTEQSEYDVLYGGPLR
mgnify:FL=1